MSDFYKIKWSYRAVHDLQRLHDFLQPLNPSAAHRAVSNIKNLILNLENTPMLGRQLAVDDTRRELYLRFGQNGYTVRYDVNFDQNTIFILRIWHSREARG